MARGVEGGGVEGVVMAPSGHAAGPLAATGRTCTRPVPT
jgi:hypothetical protein